MLPWLVFLCLVMMIERGEGSTTHPPSAHTRMQKAYDDAKAFALELPLSFHDEGKVLDDQDTASRRDEEISKPSEDKCLIKTDFTQDIVPCKTRPSSKNHDDIDHGAPSSDKILIFVSFSMPKASLQQLAQDALKYNAVLILRGLKHNSFKETASELKAMGKGGEEDARGFEGSFEINPMLFETYNITHVPVFIHVKMGQEQSRLSGNVTLPFAYKKLMEWDERGRA